MDKEIKEIKETYLSLEIVNDCVIVRENVAPQMPPKVVFCGSKKETADFIRNL